MIMIELLRAPGSQRERNDCETDLSQLPHMPVWKLTHKLLHRVHKNLLHLYTYRILRLIVGVGMLDKQMFMNHSV